MSKGLSMSHPNDEFIRAAFDGKQIEYSYNYGPYKGRWLGTLGDLRSTVHYLISGVDWSFRVKEDEKCIVIMGNPKDGFLYYGPHESHEAALQWAEEQGSKLEKDWWIVELVEAA